MEARLKRSKVLAAAAALETFTLPELAAYAGVKETTVRSVVSRNDELFARGTDADSEGRQPAEPSSTEPRFDAHPHMVAPRGRRPARYRVRDVRALKARLSEQADDLKDFLELSSYSSGLEGRLERGFDLILDGERRLLAALETENLEDRRVFLHTALTSTHWVLDDEGSGKTPIAQFEADDSSVTGQLLRRARVLRAMTVLAAAQGNRETDQSGGSSLQERRKRLSSAAAALRHVVDAVPGDLMSAYFRLFSWAAEVEHQLPPLSVITPTDSGVEHVFPELGGQDWVGEQDAARDVVRWTPIWAKDLLSTGLVPTVVVGLDNLFHLSRFVDGRHRIRSTIFLLLDSPTDAATTVAALSGYVPLSRELGFVGLLSAAHSQVVALSTTGELVASAQALRPGRAGPGAGYLDSVETGDPLGEVFGAGAGSGGPALARSLVLHESQNALSTSARVRWYNRELRYGLGSTDAGMHVVFTTPPDLTIRDLSGELVAVEFKSYSALSTAQLLPASLRDGRLPVTPRRSRQRDVVPSPGGGWDVRMPGASRASAHEQTQEGAWRRAREIVRNAGGGEVVVYGMDGTVQRSATVGGAPKKL